MKTKTEKMYKSPVLEICEMVLEAPIASSLGNALNGGSNVNGATVDDWGIL